MVEERNIQEIEDEIVENFGLFDSWEDKYEYIIDMGKALEPLEDEHKVDKNIIKGCQSTLWLVADYKEGKVFYKADSDAIIVRGLVSMMIEVLSGHKPQEILDAKFDFLQQIGMMKHLAQTRSNGLLSMIKQMRIYAQAFQAINN